jgi:hypothetical protein
MISGGDEMVSIMGADPAVPEGPAAPPPVVMVPVPMRKHISTMEKVGAVGVVLLIAGAVAYSMHKKG